MNVAKEIKDFEWDIAPLPSGPSGGYTRSGFAAYTMFKDENSQKDEEKLEMFKFLTSKEAMTVTGQFFVPSRKSVLSSDEFINLYPESIHESFKTTILDRLGKVRIPTTPQTFAKVNSEAQVYFDLLYAKSISVKEALQNIEEKVTPLMK